MAYAVHEPNQPQEDAQPVHGSGARVQDHDPGTSQPAPDDSIETIGTGHGCCRADAETVSRKTVEQVTTSQQGSQETLENATLVALFGKEDTAAESQSHAARIQDTLVNAVENAEVTEIKCAAFRALTRLKSYRDEGIRRD